MRVDAVFDWRQEGPQSWNITVDTTQGQLRLRSMGVPFAHLRHRAKANGLGEYPGRYHRFDESIVAGQSNVDVSPLQHVADAFLLGRRDVVEAFED